jgi:hypothetical protein
MSLPLIIFSFMNPVLILSKKELHRHKHELTTVGSVLLIAKILPAKSAGFEKVLVS